MHLLELLGFDKDTTRLDEVNSYEKKFVCSDCIALCEKAKMNIRMNGSVLVIPIVTIIRVQQMEESLLDPEDT